MKTLGVTGGIGSGKSTVCRMLEELGARVFYADEEGKRLLVEDASARDALVDAFGKESYHPDGTLNRAYLSNHVFGNVEHVERINAIVHPRVFDRFKAARQEAKADGVPLLVEEAALIYEAGTDEHLDAVAVVDAPRDVRIRRVVGREGVSPDDVRARMSHQLPPEELRHRADFVLDNSGNLQHLREQVEWLYRAMTSRQKRTEEP